MIFLWSVYFTASYSTKKKHDYRQEERDTWRNTKRDREREKQGEVLMTGAELDHSCELTSMKDDSSVALNAS